MAKYLKRYNEETQEWELVSAPDVSVVQKLEDGSDITDTNVIVTNINYAGESGETPNLDETLTVISDDISRLQRNVSWLAEHGGGGGGGTGSTVSFGIVIVSPVLTDGAAYVSGKTFEVEFMITGGTDGEQCEYAYVYDSNPQTDYALISVGTSVKIAIDNTGSSLKEHSMIIRAKNPYGTNIAPQSFRIYESTLTIAFDVQRAGDDYNPGTGIFNIRKDSTYANMPLLLTNGLMRSETVIVAKCQDQTYTTDSFINTTTEQQQKDISLCKLFPNKDITVGDYYVVTFQSTATLGANTIVSNEVQLRIYIISPSEISIVLGVNGTSGEIVEAPLKSSVVYNFKVYTPAFVPPVESTYYSAKIQNSTTGSEYLVLGKYYDETLKEEGATYASNDSASVGRTISSQAFLNSENYHVGDTLNLFVKIWSIDGTRSASTSTEILVVEESNEVFPRQYENRNTTDPYDTIFLSWNNENATPSTPSKWTSKNTNYGFLSGTLAETEGHTVISDINVLSNNPSSGIKTEGGISYLRLQNRAYAISDLTKYGEEVGLMTAEDSNLYGFTISFTFKTDHHNDTQHTLLLWGRNNADGTLANGIRIDADKAQWMVNERKNGAIVSHNLSCHISSGTKITVDFSYVRTANNSATARIYVNGIPNAATDLEIMSPNYVFPNTIYFGADYNNGTLGKYTDLNIYEFSVYTKSLNDMQIAINGKNARYEGIEDYTEWKAKNFISASSLDPRIPESVFFSNGKYITDFDTQQINNIAARSKFPTLYINFPDSSNFTAEYFYAKQTSSAQTFDGTATYYDPESRREATFKVKVSLQGTSTLGYRIKNLEMYVDETFSKDGVTYVKLFQPKKEWLPESQFTLKADVVDSAHANNAILGEWINNSGAFKPNPAMQNYGENRPQDWDDAYSAATTDAEREAHTYHDEPEVATIKHTLEGFPFLMFIKFSGKSSYTFLGIYSFNLGRYSYYNMGMKFLKGYSRRDGTTKVACPKIINYYEEMPTLGNISATDVISFEMGNAGNLKIKDYPVWSQYDKTVIQSYGSFRYLGAPESENMAWTNLCALFEAVAKFNVTAYNNDLYTAYQDIEYYTIDAAGNYQTNHVKIEQTNEYNTQIVARLDIENAAAYFVVANAFGMTDSLGKNLTIRSWDGGQKWWFCFYDMDTALGLANDGSENNPVTVSIDRVVMRTDSATSSSVLETIYHDNDSKYAAVLSKIWGVLRDDRFLYLQSGYKEQRYEYIWNLLRSSTGKLSTSENFSNIMAERVNACGEMIYDYDYNIKYIQDTASQEGGAAAAITFLHGTRVDYVKDWLRKHFYFLDGMFDVERLGTGTTFSYIDSPYNADIATFVVNYNSAIQVLPFTVQVSTPSFIGLGVGSDPYKKYYIEKENADTIIYFVNGTSANSQLNVKGSSILCKLDGLQGGFQAIQSNNETGVTKSLASFDANSSFSLNEDPFHKNIFGYLGDSSLESVNLSNTRGSSTLSKYEVDLSNCQKLIDVNISNSDVTTLVLPNTSLQRLSIDGSNIVNFSLSEQSVLTGISFNNCNRLATIALNSCSSLQSVSISDKPNLSSVSVLNCSSISAITISGNAALESIEIGNNAGLKRIFIENCKSPLLDINIYGCPLEEIIIRDVEAANVIKLPNRELLTGVTALDLSHDFYITGIKYGSEEIEYYEGEPIFDISSLTSLNERNLNLSYVTTLKYLRVQNDESKPFKIYNTAINKCDGLTRIFGHIEITDETTFSAFGNFFLNEMNGIPEWNDSKPTFVDDPLYTNISITASDLSNCFAGTSCNLLDVYTVFRTINTAVTSIYYMFSRCPHIVVEPAYSLPSRLFINCTNVVNINGLFADCSNIFSCLDEDILLPVIDNITEFNSVFRGCRVFIWIQGTRETIFPAGNNIASIDNFNPSYSLEKNTYDNYQITSNAILTNLDKLERLINSYNGLYIDFQADGDILFNNTALVEIQNSFTRISPYNNDLIIKHLLGKVDPEHYPQGLVYVTNSFTFSTDESSLAIGNTFFGNSNATLRSIQGSFIGIQKIIDFDDCNGLTFPYKIFSGCANLVSVAGFFEGLDCGNEGAVNTFTLPSYIIDENNRIDILGDCINVTDASRLFARMKNARYSLVGGGFKNNSLTNVSSMFNGYQSNGLVGSIPFKLFYEEDENGFPKNTITNMNSVFYFCNSSEMTYYDAHSISDSDLYEKNPDYIEGSASEETKYPYRWNKYAYDGTGSVSGETYFYDRVTGSSIYNSGQISQILPPEFIPGYSDPGKDYSQIKKEDIGTKGGQEYSDYEKMTVFAKRNYFCAPDIFKYCVNSINTNVDSIFAYTSTSDISGLFGTIPPFLFEPISEIGTLNGIFTNCRLLLPYSWGYEYKDEYAGEDYTVYGKFIPDNLFSGMTNLYSISNMFGDSKIWGRTKFNLLALPSSLSNLNSLFNNCTWIGDAGLDGTLLPLTQLVDISNMFHLSGPATMPAGILSSIYNNKISTCAYFMYMNQTTIQGTLPDLWYYPLLRNASMNNIIGSFAGINSALASTIPEDANFWFTHS